MPKLLEQVRDRIRARHYSLRTEGTYLRWVKDFILSHGKRHTTEMGAAEVRDYVTHLAVSRNVAASTQNQALSVLLFLYKEVLEINLLNGSRGSCAPRDPRACPSSSRVRCSTDWTGRGG